MFIELLFINSFTAGDMSIMSPWFQCWQHNFLSHLAEYFFGLFTIALNSAIANDLKPIGMMKMQCVTVYPNIYECASDYMKIHYDHF